MTHAMKLDCPFCKGKHTTDLQLANCPVLVAAFGRVKRNAGRNVTKKDDSLCRKRGCTKPRYTSASRSGKPLLCRTHLNAYQRERKAQLRA